MGSEAFTHTTTTVIAPISYRIDEGKGARYCFMARLRPHTRGFAMTRRLLTGSIIHAMALFSENNAIYAIRAIGFPSRYTAIPATRAIASTARS